ncbi:MAG: response regulator [Myxococcales bacterium]|jgi:two-component system, chemotaxis family, chemotaxis protein CheY|nr:response regulator [Myxococcus sp.]MDP1916504.1 response regulator [Myxococcales bacterium]MDP3235889.1 response regulator [Myxococcales bacterium]MDP3503372.1 response regulator [Myxococcales bacterium]
MAKKVLVVDDSVFMRDIIKDIFAAGGFTVVGEAGNGVEAVEKYKELKPDLVTMDLVMPYRNGIDATREILRGDNKALVVMCSALGQETMVMEAIEAGAVDFIVKPPRAEDVLAVVKKVLGEA